MNTKKIWLTAFIFGLIATGMMYVMTSGVPKQASEPASTVVTEEPEEEIVEPVEEEVEKVWQNEILPFDEGRRAMTIAVSDDQGVAGFIEAGSYIDIVAILITPEDQKEKQHDAATLLLQNVKVLAIGHAADDEATSKRYQMVTVEVTPVEGMTLSFATNYDLHLMLRKEGDDELEPKKTHVHEDELHKGVFRN